MNTESKIEIHTLRFGNAWWVNELGHTLDLWCDKYGHSLRVWSNTDVSPGYPCAKFGVIDMMRAFVSGPSDWMMFFDADIYFHPDMPDISDLSEPGFYINTDPATHYNTVFPEWCRKHFKARVKDVAGWDYRNSGVWACDRQTAKEFLCLAKQPYIRGVQEQHQWNWWLLLASNRGMRVGHLPMQWNCMPGQEFQISPPACYHMFGAKKDLQFARLKEKGFIPFNIMNTIKNGFDPTPYGIKNHPAAMDLLHIQLLHAATDLPMTTPMERRIAVEIGSFQGASTSALIEAVNQEKFAEFHIVEINPRAELMEIIAKCKFPDRVKLHAKCMWDIEFDRIDFIFIDGDHKYGAFADALTAMSYGAEVICIHDTNMPMNRDFWGSCSLGRIFRRIPGRTHFEDRLARPGCHTHRGFLVSGPGEMDFSALSAMLPGSV
jgi:hypothetical protein